MVLNKSIKDNNYFLFVDEQLLLSYTDGVETSGEIVLDSYHTQVNVSSFRIIAL